MLSLNPSPISIGGCMPLDWAREQNVHFTPWLDLASVTVEEIKGSRLGVGRAGGVNLGFVYPHLLG